MKVDIVVDTSKTSPVHTEQAFTASDTEIMDISTHLLLQNTEAYMELSK